jgi:hypothetical protein
LLKRALKHAALAAALLIPTLAGVALAPPAAQAATMSSGAPWRGLTKFVTHTTHSTDWQDWYFGIWTTTSSTTCGSNPVADLYAKSGDQTTFVGAPGSTMYLCWALDSQASTSIYDWTSASLQFADLKGSTFGTTFTLNNVNLTPGFSSSVPFAVQLDNDPLDNSAGTARTGTFEPVLSLTLGTTTTDSRGNGSLGGSFPISVSTYAQGYLDGSNGIMGGLASASGDRTLFLSNQTTAGKNFPVTRIFDTAFEAPCPHTGSSCGQGNVRTYMDDGKLVVYSAKPPTATGICPSGSNCTQWGTVANGGADTVLTAILSDLNTWSQDAGASGQAIFVFSHEPKKHASDVNGCTPYAVDCFGTSQDYRAAQTHIHNLIVSGGYTHVKLSYAEVDSNATKKATVGASTGPIGSGDLLYAGNDYTNATIRPTVLPCSLAGATVVGCVSSNIDLLGHDVYNYFLYVAGGTAGTYDTTPTWRTMSYKLFDASQGMITLAKQWNKPILFSEFGTHPGCLTGDTGEGCSISGASAETRDGWFINGERAVEQSTDALKYLLGFSYYHKTQTWNWMFFGQSTSPEKYGDYSGGTPGQGWHTAFTNSPLFVSSPITL